MRQQHDLDSQISRQHFDSTRDLLRLCGIHLRCKAFSLSIALVLDDVNPIRHSPALYGMDSTERREVRLSARETVHATSMRADASRMAAASQEHTASLTSPLFATIPLDECYLTRISLVWQAARNEE